MACPLVNQLLDPTQDTESNETAYPSVQRQHVMGPVVFITAAQRFPLIGAQKHKISFSKSTTHTSAGRGTPKSGEEHMIIALSGRRVDAVGAKQARFPLRNVPAVKKVLRRFLRRTSATCLVSSAACGADLLALSEAASLGLRRRIVIPFGREKFRETSVVDRPGDWDRIYDETMDQIEAAGDLIVLADVSGDQAYSGVNHVILDEAISLGQKLGEVVSAALVWDGVTRGVGDFTEEFGTEARKKGIEVFELSTL